MYFHRVSSRELTYEPNNPQCSKRVEHKLPAESVAEEAGQRQGDDGAHVGACVGEGAHLADLHFGRPARQHGVHHGKGDSFAQSLYYPAVQSRFGGIYEYGMSQIITVYYALVEIRELVFLVLRCWL